MNWKFWQGKPVEEKESITSVAIASMTGSGEIWPKRDYANYAKEVYQMNPVAYRCIDMISKCVSTVSWQLFNNISEEEREVVENHPINSLLKRANPETSFNYSTYEVMSYLLMAGNTYYERIRPLSGKNKGYAQELWTLRPDRMKILIDPATGRKIGYEHEANGIKNRWEIDPVTGKSDILHIKFFHPLDDWYGMAITEPAARKIDTSNALDEWNKKLLDNEARPGMLLMFKDPIGDKQHSRLKRDLAEQREGASHAGKSLILEGATDAKPYGFSPTEMDWIQSNIELARSICNTWGVPAQLIGIPDSATYANYKEARAALWEDTVIFYLNLFRGEFNNWMFEKEDNLFVDYDLDEIPALQYKRDLLWERAQGAEFLTTNEKREMTGFEAIEGGDDILVPANMLPLGEAGVIDEEVEEEEEEEVIKNVMDEGMTKEEAEELLGLD